MPVRPTMSYNEAPPPPRSPTGVHRRIATISRLVIGAFVVSLLVFPPSAHAATVVVPTTIPADCSRDVTADLNSLFTTLPAGTVLKFAAAGCYRVDGTLLVQERTNLVFDGQGASFKAFTDGTELPQPRNRAHWKLLYSNRITLKHMTIVGANLSGVYDPDLEAQHGVALNGALQTTIIDVKVRQVFGDCVTITRGTLGPTIARGTDNVTIRKLNCLVAGRQGVAITWGTNVTVQLSTLTDIERTVFDLEPTYSGWVVDNILIEDNVINSHGNYALGSGGAGCNVSNVTFRGNRIAAPGNIKVGTAPAAGCRKHDFIVEGNIATLGVGEQRFSAWDNLDDVLVNDNTVTIPSGSQDDRIGVDFENARGILTVTNNEFCGATDAVVASGSGRVTEANNNILC